jgi:ATP-dependent helicase/nuclease subunit B
MILHFSQALDSPSWPLPTQSGGGELRMGPNGTLNWLESYWGLAGHDNNNDYLRIEQYRQLILRYLIYDAEVFFKRSFEADQFAVATDLLARRDELLLEDWDFAIRSDTPARLKTIADLEALRQKENLPLAAGFAERFLVLEALQAQRSPVFQRVYLHEPLVHLPNCWQRLLQAMVQKGTALHDFETRKSFPGTDLGQFQRHLAGETLSQVAPQADGSILLVRAKRDSELATWMAALLRKNPDYRPCFFIPDKSRALDDAFIQEGLPSLGIQPSSLARPTLQVLKLVTHFLWTPIDPFKIMEFVSLPLKPLENELANRIAQQMAQTPGILGDYWQAMLAQYFGELDEKAIQDANLDPREIRRQYRFWFERRRYDLSGLAPVDEAVDIFRYLANWAQKMEEKSTNPSLILLAEQARQIADLLETLPEKELSRLELERIVRTVYEPAPMQLSLHEVGACPYVHAPAALTAQVKDLAWWGFVQNEPDYFFSRWYQNELAYLEYCQVHLPTPKDQNDRLAWQRRQPILQTKDRLLLIIPELVVGEHALPHPLLGDLEAIFTDLKPISLGLDVKSWLAFFPEVPGYEALTYRKLGSPKPFIQLVNSQKLSQRAEETFTSLESLLYYPHQWLFRHQARLRKSSILSIVKDSTLYGNLAHRFFQTLLVQPELSQWQKVEVEKWIDREAETLLAREGAVLLMYGKEPERMRFLNRIKYAAWSLITLLQQNQWQVDATERAMEGVFADLQLQARADLVLSREKALAVLDLKWRGAVYREQMIRNEEDLQLALYSHLLSEQRAEVHSAYFILENGKLIVRDNRAFAKVNAVSPGLDAEEVRQRILLKIEKTLRWRLNQLEIGDLEVRCKQTFPALELHYEPELMLDLLEMKTEDAAFDDYRTLIDLVE